MELLSQHRLRLRSISYSWSTNDYRLQPNTNKTVQRRRYSATRVLRKIWWNERILLKMKYWVCAASEKYVPQMQVLEESVKQHEPKYKFIALAPPPDMQQAVQYRMTEVLRLLDAGATEVVESGADVWLLDSLNLSRFEGQLLFCPHLFELPAESQMVTMMKGGLVNSDFQVWRQGSQEFLRRILATVKSRKPDIDFEGEQAWLPFALSCLDAKLILDEDIGIAYYNLHERSIGPYATLIHFSGWEMADPKRFSKHPVPRELDAYEQRVFNTYTRAVLGKTLEAAKVSG